MAETLVTLLVVGIIITLLICTLNINNKNAVNNIKYRKIYDNLSTATKAANLTPTGLQRAFTSDPEQVMDMISNVVPTTERFQGCKYENLNQLVGESACNATNVQGATLSDGTPISFVSNNSDTNLDNKLIGNYGKKLKKGLVGAFVVNDNSGEINSGSIIPVYEDGFGALEISQKTSVFNLGGDENNEAEIANNCSAIDHVYVFGECRNPSQENCADAGTVFYNAKCEIPTTKICKELGKVLFEGQCRDCSTKFIDDVREIYSILQRAIERSIEVNGPISGWTFKADGWRAGNPPNATFFATTYIVPYLDVDYICTYSKNSRKCFYGPSNEFYGEWKGWNCGHASNLEVITTYAGAGQSYMVRLKNGMSVAISEYSADVKIIVDIDGPDVGQSVTGYDVFEFLLNKNGFGPYRLSWFGNNCTTTGNPCSGAQHHGGGRPCCAAYIIDNNWTRPDNYPYCHE